MTLRHLKEDSTNKSKIGIVCVGYNRIKSMKRLLGSLLLSRYPSNDIPLVISIDCSGDTELYEYVQNFHWPYGRKYVNIQEERLGLKKHIYQCGDLTEYFKAIILLEDDLFVSPEFYSYVIKAVNKYANDSRIAQISLYKNEYNGYVGLPFLNVQDGFDTFLMQDVSTWGECWTESMWRRFKEWRDSHTEEDIESIDMPDRIKGWDRAWSKYYNAYVVDTNKYVLYPNISLSTNFSDAGEHGGDNNSVVQVNLLQEDFEYRMGEFDCLSSYDIYFNNEDIYKWLEISREDICLDVYGFHSNNKNRKYILSTRSLPYKVVKAFALNIRPIELNVKYNVEGDGLFLYDTSETQKIQGCRNNKYCNSIVPYFLAGFNKRLLLDYLFRFYLSVIVRKLKFK